MVKRQPPTGDAYLLFDVVYEDGSLSSNRKVLRAELDGIKDLAGAKAQIEAQDRAIAERSGRPKAAVKSVKLSGKKS